MGAIFTKLGFRSNYRKLTRDIIKKIKLTEYNKLVLNKDMSI